jgi:hypothetical protein
MNTETIQKNQLVGAEVELDPLSNRYRVCPNCQTPHMVRNKGRDFCSDRCADQHYNARRRLLKQALQTVQIKPTEVATTESDTTSAAATDYRACAENHDKNLQILNSLSIDTKNGTVIHSDDLLSRGFDFELSSGRGVLYNIDPSLNCHFMQYGVYRIYRVDFSQLLIYKFQTTKNENHD